MQMTRLCAQGERNRTLIVINSTAIYKRWKQSLPNATPSPARPSQVKPEKVIRGSKRSARCPVTLTLLTNALATVLPMWVSAAVPAPFSAVYNAHYNGLPLKAKALRELHLADNGQFKFTSTASTFFAHIQESSTFEWTEAGPIPSRYAYERKGLGKKRRTDVHFNWATSTAANVARRKPWTLNLAPGTLDKLSVQMKLRVDVRELVEEGRTKPLVYDIAENGRIKRFEFELLGKEIIETPMGGLETVKIRRVRTKDSKRETLFWLASAHDFLLVRMYQREHNGTRFELVIRSLVAPDHS